MSSDPVLDKQTALLRLNHNEALYNRVLALFEVQAEDMLSTLHSAVLSDAEELLRPVHTLKGSAGEIGATRLYNVAQRVEQTLKLNPQHLAAADIEMLKGEIETLLDTIRHTA